MKLFKTVMRYVLGLFFVLAGINHFRDPEFYTNIMPGYLPVWALYFRLVFQSVFIAWAWWFTRPDHTPATETETERA